MTKWGKVEHAAITLPGGLTRNGENEISWSLKMEIKNELFGENRLAIEVFPKSKNLVDIMDVYHLWVFPKEFTARQQAEELEKRLMSDGRSEAFATTIAALTTQREELSSSAGITPEMLQRYTNAKHPQRIYSCKTYNAFGKNHCTQHRIDYDTLYSHVLRKIRECARAALMDGEAVADRLTNTCEAEQREQREAMERSLTRDEERIEVLDKMVMRLYEDMIAGRISEQNFNTMLEKTQTEQTELKTKVSEGRKRLSDEVQLANDAKQWVEAIQEYANITELDAATLNRLIKEIVVHERIDEDKTRHISIEIHFNLKPIPEVEQVTA